MEKIYKLDNLSVEDALIISELAPILDIVTAKPLEGGSERKFYLETSTGKRQMIRIGSINDWGYTCIKEGDDTFAYIASAGLPVTRMLNYGLCANGTLYYQLHTWLDGEGLHTVIPTLNSDDQYALGVKCGIVAKKLHSLPLMPNDDGKWDVWFKNDALEMIQLYENNPVKTQEMNLLIAYLKNNIDLIDDRPQTMTHGDWNSSNLILMPDGEIGIIDYGITGSDPWCEFWGVDDSAHFCTGQIKGYFDGEPPDGYFPLLALYIVKGVLQWDYDKKRVLEVFNNMNNLVPSWYLKDY